MTGTAPFGLLLAMAVYGCADGFLGPASSALLPDVVPGGQFAAANALVGGSTSSARIAAPAVAGLIVAASGPGSAFAFQAAVLAIAVGCLAAARLSPGSGARPGQAGPLRQFQAGWAEFARLR